MLVEGCHLVFSFTLHVIDILSLKTDAFKGSLIENVHYLLIL